MEEDQISLKYMFRSFIRHWPTIIYFVCCFFAVGIVYVKLLNQPKYMSVGVIASTNSSAETSSTVISVVKNDQVVATGVYKNLKNEGVHHKNGSEISLNEISLGIDVANPSSNVQFKITFTNSDETIVERVLNEVLTVSIDSIESNYPKKYYLSIVSNATAPENIAKSNVVIIGLSTFAGIIIGAVCSLVEEKRQNALYEIDDIKKYDANVFGIEYIKEKKHEISK